MKKCDIMTIQYSLAQWKVAAKQLPCSLDIFANSVRIHIIYMSDVPHVIMYAFRNLLQHFPGNFGLVLFLCMAWCAQYLCCLINRRVCARARVYVGVLCVAFAWCAWLERPANGIFYRSQTRGVKIQTARHSPKENPPLRGQHLDLRARVQRSWDFAIWSQASLDTINGCRHLSYTVVMIWCSCFCMWWWGYYGFLLVYGFYVCELCFTFAYINLQKWYIYNVTTASECRFQRNVLIPNCVLKNNER